MRRQKRDDSRWLRVKAAKNFTRLAYAMVAGQQMLRHPCLQKRHYILDKLSLFHVEHGTPSPQVLADLQAAVAQLPASERQAEAAPLAEQLNKINQQHRGRSGPQLLGNIIPIVLAKLGIHPLQSTTEVQNPG